MPGGCFTCNPICGYCKPAMKKSTQCPECSSFEVFDRADLIEKRPLICRSCGNDLSEEVYPEAVDCIHSGLPCAYPCGRSGEPFAGDGIFICEFNVPPDR